MKNFNPILKLMSKYQSKLNQLATCHCCPRQCGADRLDGKTGQCGMADKIKVSYAGLHHGEEPPISGYKGSGTIFFAGCNLHCVFCQNYQISQEFLHTPLQSWTSTDLALEMMSLQVRGAHNINFVSPSQMVFQIAEAIEIARKKGLAIPTIYNSNGYDSLDVLKQVKGLFDIYMPDLKYMDNLSGERLSDVKDYAEIAPKAIQEMLNQVGQLELDGEGIAQKGILVRHLVLPGLIENSEKCLAFLAELSPQIHVSIMSQYSPRYKADSNPLINRPLRCHEYQRILDFALGLGLDNAFIQELSSQDHCLPDFNSKKPFDE
ncbi:radical SAM protein [bacterium]|nr:radical SAM protein [bacterium]